MLTLASALVAAGLVVACPPKSEETVATVAQKNAATGDCASKCPVSGGSQIVSLGAVADNHTEKQDIVDTAVAAGSFKTLAAALQAAGLVEALKGTGPFTVFAPTDEAFAKLPKGTLEMLLKPENKDKLAAILTYHVVPGKVTADKVTTLKFADTLGGQRLDIVVKDGTVMVDNAKVVKTDVMATNGVIHVIDAVMLPSTQTIVEVARENGFSTLAAAIEAAGLVETLSGKGPFTVFAPTNAAFAKLPKDTLEMLLKPENKAKLVEILTYHVVPGRVYSDKAMGLTAAKTVQGDTLALKVVGGKLMVGAATVTAADVESRNGVIHVIDTVLIPG